MLGRIVAAPEQAVVVGGDVRDRVRARAGDDTVHELGGEPGERPLAALLPGAHEPFGRVVVGDRSPRPGERDPPARALPAALDRPGRRRAAALAERPSEALEILLTLVAEDDAVRAAHDTAPREDEVQQHPATLRTLSSPNRARSVNIRTASAGPRAPGACCRRPAAGPGRRCRATRRARDSRRRARGCAARL